MRIGGRDQTVPLQLGDADGNFNDMNFVGQHFWAKGYLFPQLGVTNK
jgi:hypothetical protein